MSAEQVTWRAAWQKADTTRFPADLREWVDRQVRIWQYTEHHALLEAEVKRIRAQDLAEVVGKVSGDFLT